MSVEEGERDKTGGRREGLQESSVLSLHFTDCRGKTNNMGSVSAKWGEGGGGP